MTGMFSLRASATARCSLLVSTTHTAEGDLGHVADTTESAVQLGHLTREHEDFLLGATLEATGLLHGLELLEAEKTLVDGGEVGEHAAEPTLVDVGHPDASGLGRDGLLGLLLGADEQDGAAVGNGLLDEFVRLVDVRQRLLQVDDVDAVAVGEDESLHLRVPTTGLVTEVRAAVEQLLHCYDSHGCVSLFHCRLMQSVSRRSTLAPADHRTHTEMRDQPMADNLRGRAKSDCGSTDRSISVRPPRRTP